MFGSCEPSPRKPRPATSMIAVAIASVPCTITGDIAFGRMCENRITGRRTPTERAARTKSFSRCASTEPRRSRAKIGMLTTPTATMIGRRTGASTAAATKQSTKKAPTIAPGFRISRRQASLQSPLGASSWISRASSSTTDTSAVPDPRVDDRVREVDDQVHDYEDEGEEQDPPLEHRIVAAEDRVSQPRAHSRVREDRLGENGAGEEEAGLEPDDRR